MPRCGDQHIWMCVERSGAMSEKVPCTVCGVMILVATAQSNGGQCMPCKQGTRKTIDNARLQYAERKKAEANPSPETKHWRWLVRQVRDGGFDGLSPENQLYFAVCLLEGEIYNGGFEQYFHNSSANYFAQAL